MSGAQRGQRGGERQSGDRRGRDNGLNQADKTTLHDLGDTVDRHDSLDVDRLLGLATTVVASATVARATAALSALGSAHEMCSISKFSLWSR